MCKKLLIAAVAVLIGVVVVKGTKVGGLMKVWKNRASAWAERQVPPEDEIARLRTEIQSLQDQDKHLYHQVATQLVDLENREKEIADLQAKLDKQEGRIRRMYAALKTADKDEFVVYDGTRYPREELQDEVRTYAAEFKSAEENLKSKEAQLRAFRKTVAYNKAKLKELNRTRRDMETELAKLEATLQEERLARAQSEGTLRVDDSHYTRLREDMNHLRTRIEVMKKERVLRGESVAGPVRAAEEAKEKKAALDQYTEARFGENGKTKVAGK